MQPIYGQISFYTRVTFPKMLHKSNTKFQSTTLYFLGVRGLTASSDIVYDYTISGHKDLYSIYVDNRGVEKTT